MRLSAWVTFAQFATGKHLVIRRILDLSPWCHLHNFQKVKLVIRVFFTLHNKHVLEALVICGSVMRWTIAQTVNIKALKRFGHTTGVMGARTLTRIGV